MPKNRHGIPFKQTANYKQIRAALRHIGQVMGMTEAEVIEGWGYGDGGDYVSLAQNEAALARARAFLDNERVEEQQRGLDFDDQPQVFARKRRAAKRPTARKKQVKLDAWHSADFNCWMIDVTDASPAGTAWAKKKYAKFWQGASGPDHFQLGDIPDEATAEDIEADIAIEDARLRGRKRSVARRNMASPAVKAWRTSMRKKHGPDWWKDERLKATKPGGTLAEVIREGRSERKPRKPRGSSAKSSTKGVKSSEAMLGARRRQLDKWHTFVPATGELDVEASTFGSEGTTRVTLTKPKGVWTVTKYEREGSKPWRATDAEVFAKRADAIANLESRVSYMLVYRVNGEYIHANDEAEYALAAEKAVEAGKTSKPRKPRGSSAKSSSSAKTATSGIVTTSKFKPSSRGKGLEGALAATPPNPRFTQAEREKFARAALVPVWSADGAIGGEGPGYLSMFEGLYVPFTGALTKAKVMAAAKKSLHEIGGSDHRFIESVYKMKEKVNGLPVWAIGTGS